MGSSTPGSGPAESTPDPPDEPDDTDIVITPGGPRPRSSTHYVPPGSAVRRQPDGSLTVEPATPSADESSYLPDSDDAPDPEPSTDSETPS
jgi:hypothetical protein